MRKSALWLLASLSIATTACVRTATNEATGAVDVDIESPTKQGEDWKGTLRGQGMYTSVTGTARALYNEGRTSVTVTLENASPNASYMWDVREGKCGANGAVVGSVALASSAATTSAARLNAARNAGPRRRRINPPMQRTGAAV